MCTCYDIWETDRSSDADISLDFPLIDSPSVERVHAVLSETSHHPHYNAEAAWWLLKFSPLEIRLLFVF